MIEALKVEVNQNKVEMNEKTEELNKKKINTNVYTQEIEAIWNKLRNID